MQLPDWLCYQFPAEQLVHWVATGKGGFGGKYRGQAQRWFVFRFLGADSEIDISGLGAPARRCRCCPRSPAWRAPTHPAHSPCAGHKAEFVEWRWAALDDGIVQEVVPFKRQVYRSVLEAVHMIVEAAPR